MVISGVHLIERIGLIALGCFSLHRVWLLGLWCRFRRETVHPPAAFARLPRVTVQLPVFNEPYVIERLLEAVGRFDYPRDRVEIQVLDDSTDETPALVAACVARMQAQGHRIQHVRRRHRAGFKAGALAHGLTMARGEFIAIFDADFVPPADFLTRTIHHFTDPRVGMVQARWGHLNASASLLTRAQALMLDGHFLIEQVARSRSGCFFNFNGSAGVWRAQAILDAGGWRADTLTEDLDLSYRAQLRGWRFLYLPDVVVPAELPREMRSLKTQQHRWTKGSIQTALQLLPKIVRARQSLRVKGEACFHLGNWFHYPLGLLFSMLILPTLMLARTLSVHHSGSGWEGIVGVALVTTSALFYGLAHAHGRGFRASFCIDFPVLLAVSMGLALNNSRGVVEGLRGDVSPFFRTPKYNGRRSAAQDPSYRPQLSDATWWWAEAALGLYILVAINYAFAHRLYAVIPFLVPLAAGFLCAGLTSLAPSLHAMTETFWTWRKPEKVYELG